MPNIINNKEGTGKALSRVASVNFDQKNYDEALVYFLKALDIFNDLNHIVRLYK